MNERELYKEPGILTKDRDRRGRKITTRDLQVMSAQNMGDKDA